jgi:hypothetical protein
MSIKEPKIAMLYCQESNRDEGCLVRNGLNAYFKTSARPLDDSRLGFQRSINEF